MDFLMRTSVIVFGWQSDVRGFGEDKTEVCPGENDGQMTAEQRQQIAEGRRICLTVALPFVML